MTILSGNRTVNEFEGATRAREAHQRRLEEKIANNRALADSHRMPGGGPKAEVVIDRADPPAGSIKGGG